MRNTLYIISCVMFLFLSAVAGSADNVPTAEDIEATAKRTRQAIDIFMQQSRQLRMGYEYSGKFLAQDDKDNLHKLAEKASDQLEAISESQQKLKRQIEDYEGNDWDDRYGSTGLWRKLSTELYITRLSKCEIDYYLALCANPPNKDKILQEIQSQIISLEKIHRSANLQLLRAKILVLAQLDATWKISATDTLNSLMVESEVSDAIYFRAAIERIKLFSIGKQEAINSLADELSQSSCANDLELILSLAFLQQQYDSGSLEKTVQRFPQIEGFLGPLVLANLSRRIAQQQSLQQIGLFEAELAAQAAWKDKPSDHKILLSHLSNTERFQTPLILYAAAVAFAESSSTKAVNLLVKASNLQQLSKDNHIDIEAYKIAEQAVQLAYNLFIDDSNNCQFTLEAFDNYSQMAGDKIDAELEYLYSIILDNCGRTIESKKLLQKIADSPGNWRNKAGLGLSRALRQSGKQTESAHYLLTAIEPDHCEYAGEAMELLTQITDKIEQVQAQADDFFKMVQNCKKLAKFCYDCLEGTEKQQAGLYLAELTVFAAEKKEEKLLAIEKLLDSLAKELGDSNVDLLRCRARLLTEQGKFPKAAELWTQVAKIRKDEVFSANQRSWKWWRARFYELYCWATTSQVEKQNVLHTIEVLENSFTDIPPLWAEKLNRLKQQRYNQPISVSK